MGTFSFGDLSNGSVRILQFTGVSETILGIECLVGPTSSFVFHMCLVSVLLLVSFLLLAFGFLKCCLFLAES